MLWWFPVVNKYMYPKLKYHNNCFPRSSLPDPPRREKSRAQLHVSFPTEAMLIYFHFPNGKIFS